MTGAAGAAAILEVDGLTKRFGGLTAVNGVSFGVREREILSVIGPNGAGKSTLFKLIASFLTPTAGSVRFRGQRISGRAPHQVARLGVAIIQELQGAGIAACGKHFPGHGDTLVDSHHDLPVVDHDPERLRAVEFVPFRAAIAADVASLMSCHVLVPAFDELRPGTLSPAIVQGLMRDELGWQGLVFTDDMEMKAITSRMPVPEACVAAVAAGCDAVLVCSGNHDLQAATIEALIRAVETGVLPYARVEQALAHQRSAKERFLAAPAAASGSRSPW